MVAVKRKMLFLDDSTKRLEDARLKYRDDFDITLVTNVKECLRYLSAYEYDILNLDCDLGGEDYVDPDLPNSAMELVRYLQKTEWPFEKKKPVVIIHSSNIFVSSLICHTLLDMGFDASRKRYEYQSEKRYNRGLVAGTFDILHPGYIRLFSEAKTVCRFLIIALHYDPHRARKEKYPPLFSLQERMEALISLRQVDQIIPYKTEKDLYNILAVNPPDIMFLGDDYRDKPYTGASLGIPIHYINRDHGWSYTKVRELLIKQSEAKK